LHLQFPKFLLGYLKNLTDLSSNDPKQISAIVDSVLVHPSIFVFAELLESPRVKTLETADANTFGLLKLFTFGTLPELKGKKLEIN